MRMKVVFSGSKNRRLPKSQVPCRSMAHSTGAGAINPSRFSVFGKNGRQSLHYPVRPLLDPLMDPLSCCLSLISAKIRSRLGLSIGDRAQLAEEFPTGKGAPVHNARPGQLQITFALRNTHESRSSKPNNREGTDFQRPGFPLRRSPPKWPVLPRGRAASRVRRNRSPARTEVSRARGPRIALWSGETS